MSVDELVEELRKQIRAEVEEEVRLKTLKEVHIMLIKEYNTLRLIYDIEKDKETVNAIDIAYTNGSLNQSLVSCARVEKMYTEMNENVDSLHTGRTGL